MSVECEQRCLPLPMRNGLHAKACIPRIQQIFRYYGERIIVVVSQGPMPDKPNCFSPA
jgi:hypothetical protein